MTKFEIPPITRPLDLGDYAEELRGLMIYVWVNCPRSFQNEYYDLLKASQALPGLLKHQATSEEKVSMVNESGLKIAAWVAELWSKNIADSWTAEQVTILSNSDTDPALYPWALNRSWAMIHEHHDRSKKK